MCESATNQLYNKPEHRHTLVGNWQEEQKLLETTGTHRYKVCRSAYRSMRGREVVLLLHSSLASGGHFLHVALDKARPRSITICHKTRQARAAAYLRESLRTL